MGLDTYAVRNAAKRRKRRQTVASLSPEALARASSRHPKRTLAIWGVLIVVGGVLSGLLLSGVLTTDAQFTNEPEAVRAQNLVDERLRERGITEAFILRPTSG